MQPESIVAVQAEARNSLPRGSGGAAVPGVLVILGASGDLTKRLLMPALYNLACDSLLPAEFAVIGMARRALDTTAFRLQQRGDIQRFHTGRDFDIDRWAWLESRLHYMSGDFGDAAAYTRLRDLVLAVGGESGAADNTLLYLAISPEFFQTVNGLLNGAGFTQLQAAGKSSSKNRSARIWNRPWP